MKITFEGRTLGEILDQLMDMLNAFPRPAEINTNTLSEKANTTALPTAAPGVGAQGPGPDPVPSDNVPVDKALDNPGKTPKARTAKQLENDERLRERAASKKAAKPAKAPPVQKTLDELMEEDAAAAAAKAPKTAPPPLDPAEVVKMRQKTIEDLQSAYANGHQKEVFDLLGRFGNGAKSFRELPPEAFLPIREAIDNGALA